jgi:hypothetical protein
MRTSLGELYQPLAWCVPDESTEFVQFAGSIRQKAGAESTDEQEIHL